MTAARSVPLTRSAGRVSASERHIVFSSSRSWLLLFASAASAACSRSNPEIAPDPPRSAVQAASHRTPPTCPLVPRGVRFEKVADGDLATIIRDANARETAQGRAVCVYVGAKWCEPCQRFHDAAAAGTLDDEFPTLTFVELDADVDKDRLVRAGYASDLIPLFAKPGPDGRGTNAKVSGSVKGNGAVPNIVPRLRKLMANGG